MFRDLLKRNTATSMALRLSMHRRLQNGLLLASSEEKNDPISQQRKGYCYENGIGVKINQALAFEYYQKAALNGYLDAYANLFFCYSFGIGVEENNEKFLECLRKIMNTETPAGIFSKAVCYSKGVCGYSRDDKQSMALLEEAAKQGYVLAQYFLANFLQHEQSKIVWHQKAADQGLISSILALGEIYRDGSANVKDKYKAILCFNRAIQAGDETAKQQLRLTLLGPDYTKIHFQKTTKIQSYNYNNYNDEGGAPFGGKLSGEDEIGWGTRSLWHEFDGTHSFKLKEDNIIRFAGQKRAIVYNIHSGDIVTTIPIVKMMSKSVTIQKATELPNGKIICAYTGYHESEDRITLFDPETNKEVIFANYLPKQIALLNHSQFALLSKSKIEIFQFEEEKQASKKELPPTRIALLESNIRDFLNIVSLPNNEFVIGYVNGDIDFYKLNKNNQLELIEQIRNTDNKKAIAFSKTQFIVSAQLNRLFVLHAILDFKQTPASEPQRAYVLDNYDLNLKERTDRIFLFSPGKSEFPSTTTRLLPDNKTLVMVKRAYKEAWVIDLEAKMLHPIPLPYENDGKLRLHHILENGKIIYLSKEESEQLKIYIPQALLEYVHKRMQTNITSCTQTFFKTNLPQGVVREITQYVGTDYGPIASGL